MSLEQDTKPFEEPFDKAFFSQVEQLREKIDQDPGQSFQGVVHNEWNRDVAKLQEYFVGRHALMGVFMGRVEQVMKLLGNEDGINIVASLDIDPIQLNQEDQALFPKCDNDEDGRFWTYDPVSALKLTYSQTAKDDVPLSYFRISLEAGRYFLTNDLYYEKDTGNRVFSSYIDIGYSHGGYYGQVKGIRIIADVAKLINFFVRQKNKSAQPIEPAN
ncbi:MAG: hypothetical protein V1808_04225 [Candidatus Daviesbacteria bacterium]